MKPSSQLSKQTSLLLPSTSRNQPITRRSSQKSNFQLPLFLQHKAPSMNFEVSSQHIKNMFRLLQGSDKMIGDGDGNEGVSGNRDEGGGGNRGGGVRGGNSGGGDGIKDEIQDGIKDGIKDGISLPENETGNKSGFMTNITIKPIVSLFSNNHSLNLPLINAFAATKMGIRNFDNMQNQDAILVDSVSTTVKIFGIFDGHGEHGRLMACTARTVFANFIKKYSQQLKKEQSIFKIETIVKKTLEKTNSYLLHYKVEQSQFSGTTALIAILTFHKLYIFNVGNSRAVLGKTYPQSQYNLKILPTICPDSAKKEVCVQIGNSGNSGDSGDSGDSGNSGSSVPSVPSEHSNEDSFDILEEQIQAFQLTQDQTINRFDERLRILENDGVIKPFKDNGGEYLGPERIWVKNQSYPGIFITRALGLSCSYKIGVISQPQVTVLEYKQSHKFVILASDGFWDVKDPTEVVQFIQPFLNNGKIDVGIKLLMDDATKKWKEKTHLMDDISLIVIPFG